MGKISRFMVGQSALAKWLPLVAVLSSCGGTNEIDYRSGDPGKAGGGAILPAAVDESHIAGEKLAHIDVTPSHSVELWEIQPGNVVMVQDFDASAGEQALDLSTLLTQVKGSYSGLYRALLKDEGAALPSALVAADERQQHLPVRHAGDAIPAQPTRPAEALSHGEAIDLPSSQASIPALQGGTTVKKLDKSEGYGNNLTLGFLCQPPHTDGGFCPGWWFGIRPGTYNSFAYGSATDAIFYDSVGVNPQGGELSDTTTWDYYDLYRWDGSAWVSQLHNRVYRGHAIRVTYQGAPLGLMGSITGKLVQYGDGYRLPFPNLTLNSIYPDWIGTDFTNDIQGMTHENYFGSAGWFFSRTEFGWGKTSLYGVIGWADFSRNLADEDNGWPYRSGGINDYDEPQAWRNQNYAHYGDIATDLKRARLFVSINAANNTNAGVGVLKISDNLLGPPGLTDLGTVSLNPSESASWVAYDQNADYVYTPMGSTGVHVDQIGLGVPNAAPVTHIGEVSFVNLASVASSIDAINGAKVSSHGKLWLWAAVTHTMYQLIGVDPFTGIIQYCVPVFVNPNQFCAPLYCPDSVEEAEGLDITDESTTRLPWQMAGQIHVQLLGNHRTTNDEVRILNYKADDLSRL